MESDRLAVPSPCRGHVFQHLQGHPGLRSREVFEEDLNKHLLAVPNLDLEESVGVDLSPSGADQGAVEGPGRFAGENPDQLPGRIPMDQACRAGFIVYQDSEEVVMGFPGRLGFQHWNLLPASSSSSRCRKGAFCQMRLA